MPWLAGACAASVVVVVMLREELTARPVPTLMRLAADGAALLAAVVLGLAIPVFAAAIAA